MNPLAADLLTHLAAPARLQRWRDDPVTYAAERLGVELWSGQQEILRAIAAHKRVAVRSGHKIGKSMSAAIAALWWFETRSRARVILTSSGGRQVGEVLWREVTQLCAAARRRGLLGPDFPVPSKVPNTGLRALDGSARQVIGFSTDEPELMAGFSSPDLLYLVDEASGVDDLIYEAMEGNIAGGGQIACFSNPTQTSGFFYAAFHDARTAWNTIHISSETTPNVVQGRMVVPGLAGLEWIQDRRIAWGEESPLYQVRVRGDFATHASDRVIGIAAVEAARKRWDARRALKLPITPALGRLEIGVDVARFGDDDSVIWPRRGLVALEPEVLHGQDTQAIAGAVLALARRLRATTDERPVPRAKVDTIGVGGGVADALRAQALMLPGGVPELEVVDVNVSEHATAEGFVRLRDQIWFAVRDWLVGGGELPNRPRAEAELVAPRYAFDAQGRAKVDGKDQIKERLSRSPDEADALGLSVYCPPSHGAKSTQGRVVREMAQRKGGF